MTRRGKNWAVVERRWIPVSRPIFGDPYWIALRGPYVTEYSQLPENYIVTEEDALSAGLCIEGVIEFIRAYLSGRRRVTVAELLRVAPAGREREIGRVLVAAWRNRKWCRVCGQLVGRHSPWCWEEQA